MHYIKESIYKSIFGALALISLFLIASCSKDSKTQHGPSTAAPTKLGVYEVDSANYKELDIIISKIGDKSTNLSLIFDTGSGGMVIDGNGIVPPSMITSSGFNFTGDSTVINGITLTKQTSTVTYGDDNNSTSTVYGNLAYASVTIGDSHGNITVKRLPFFMYYKAVSSNGSIVPAHKFDVFGVTPENEVTFSNGAYITSPLSYFNPGNGLTKGFKLAALGTSNFSPKGTYVPAITLGLTDADLASGFNINPLVPIGNRGYVAVLPGLIGYANQSIPSEMVFDTGTSPYSIIEDQNWPYSAGLLKPNIYISLTTSAKFSYSYTVSATDNLTVIENPANSGSSLSIFGLDFFLTNEYMIDYEHYTIGLKNN